MFGQYTKSSNPNLSHQNHSSGSHLLDLQPQHLTEIHCLGLDLQDVPCDQRPELEIMFFGALEDN